MKWIKEVVTKFRLTYYIDQCNREQPIYEMDWKSFSILAMGFDGERAFHWKLRFADAFEEMAFKLRSESEQPYYNISDYFRKGQTLSRISEDDAALERIFRKRKHLLMEMGFDSNHAISKAFESIKNSFGIDLSERMGIELPEIHLKNSESLQSYTKIQNLLIIQEYLKYQTKIQNLIPVLKFPQPTEAGTLTQEEKIKKENRYSILLKRSEAKNARNISVCGIRRKQIGLLMK